MIVCFSGSFFLYLFFSSFFGFLRDFLRRVVGLVFVGVYVGKLWFFGVVVSCFLGFAWGEGVSGC